MVKIQIIFFLLMAFLTFFSDSVSAYDTCNETSFCQGGAWMAKKCTPSDVAEKVCEKTGEGCDKLCTCTFKPTGESCDEVNPNKNTEINGIIGKVTPPKAVSGLGGGEAGINNLLGKVVQLIFVVATVGFVFMVLISAVQLILSGGDKEALGKARGRLTWAIIGIVLLSLSFVIFRVLENITGFKFTI